ncbi:hypothetical protein RI367_000309 [Sorochytrium milnesiophthora]
MDNTTRNTLKQVFEYLGLIFWSFQLAPQAWRNFKSGSCGELSVWMMVAWGLWASFFGASAIASKLAAPMIVQPNLFGALTAVCLAQCIAYQPAKRGRRKTLLLVLVASLAVIGAVEVALYFAILNGPKWIAEVVDWASLLLIIVGFVPQYYAVYMARSVAGISRAFVLCDILGGVLSIIALALYPPPFHGRKCASYAGVVVLDIGLLLLSCIYGTGQRA